MGIQETYRIIVVAETSDAKKKFSELARMASEVANPSAQLKKAGAGARGPGAGLQSALNSDRIRYIKAETNAYATELNNQKRLRIKAIKDGEQLTSLNLSGERQAQLKAMRSAEQMRNLNLNGERQAQLKANSLREQMRNLNLSGERQAQIRANKDAEYMRNLNLSGERQAQLKKMAAARAAERQRVYDAARQAHFSRNNSDAASLVNVGSQAYFLKRALATIGVIGFAREMVMMADAAKASQNRLRNLTGSAEELSAVTAQLRSISQETRSSFEGTSEIYTRMAFATQGLGYSQAQLLGVTKSLNQAVLISGARNQEATAALIQFSQALGSNRLGGDEFRSVSEQLPYVMKIIADSLGVPVGRLRALAFEGKLTTKVLIDAFVNASDKIEAASKNVLPTIEQAVATFRNSVLFFVADMDSATGASDSLSRAIMGLAKNIDFLGRAFAALLLTGVAGLAYSQLSKLFGFMAGQLSLIWNLTKVVRSGLITLGTAISVFSGPIAGAILLATSALLVFSDKIILNEKVGTSLRDMWAAFGTVVWKGFQQATQGITRFIENLRYAQEVARMLQRSLTSIEQPVEARRFIGPELPELSKLQEYMVNAARLFDAPIKFGARLLNQWSLTLDALLEKFVDVINKIELLAVTTVDKKRLQLLGGLRDVVTKVADEKTAQTVVDPLINTVVTSMLVDQTKIKQRENEWRGAGAALAAAAKNGFQDESAGFFEKFMRDWSNTANLSAAARRAAPGASLTGKSAPAITAPADKDLSKWDRYVEKLRDALELLRLQGSERDKSIQKEVFDAQRTLGVRELTAAQESTVRSLAAQIFDETALLEIRQQMLNLAKENSNQLILDNSARETARALEDLALQAKRPLTDAEKQYATLLLKNNQYLQRRNALYEEIVRPLEDLKQRELDLGQMLNDKVINAQQYAMAIRDVRADITELDNTVGLKLTASTEKARKRFAELGDSSIKDGGFVVDFGRAAVAVFQALGDIIGSIDIKLSGGIANGLARIRQRANELGREVSNVLVSAFDGVTDAIVRFADTGKIGIRDLIALIHQLSMDLVRLAANQLWAQLLGAGAQSLLPVGSAPVVSDALATTGARRQPSLSPQSNRQSSNQSSVVVPPPVVHVYNILDPKDIPAALESPAGRKAILNVISRNPSVLGRLAGAS